jgi:carbon starvation protein
MARVGVARGVDLRGMELVTGIALHRDEPVNALCVLTAAVCVYLLGYRFHAA